MEALNAMGKRAKRGAAVLASSLSSQRNAALLAIAKSLRERSGDILLSNSMDLKAADQNGISTAMQDRLRLDSDRIQAIARAVEEVAGQEDPVGRLLGGQTRPNGLRIEKIAVPLGVVGIIFESRPNVTVDCAALCLKSGNACVLRGGKEAIHSNMALAGVIRDAISSAGLPADCVQLLEDTSRQTAVEMMRLREYIDVLIPRGGAGLIASVVENASIPVIETAAGNCHIYIDADADLQMAVDIVDNAKTSRPSVCNAVETLLVHQKAAAEFLPAAQKQLDKAGVELRGCDETRRILGDAVTAVTDEDYATEFNDYILAVRVVDSLEQAVEHIRRYSTGHSEAIVTSSYAAAQGFTAEVDSTTVYVNASTRYTDGGEFGLGAEIGISTQKLHARGPMGLEALTSYKYIVSGNGQIR